MQRVVVDRDFNKPRQQVFDYLSEHENLQKVFGLKVERVRDGTDGTRNGVGSVRKLSIGGLLPFEETTTEVTPGERIVYRITKGGPLKDHRGEMRFTDTASGGSHLHYEITFGGKVPGLATVVAKGLKRGIVKGLDVVEREA